VAFSNDLGKTFSNPIRVDGGKPQGRVDLQWIDEKTIIATWLEANEENSSIVYRKIGTDGSNFEMNTIETLGGGRGIGYPQMEIVGNHILFLWTNPIEKTHIQSKLVINNHASL